MQDSGWLDLDERTRQGIIALSFDDEIAADPGWLSLPEETKTGVRSMYLEDAASASESAIVPEERTALGSIGAGLASGGIGILESVGTGIQWLGNRLGLDQLADFGEERAEVYGRAADRFAPSKDIAGKNVWDNPELLLNSTYWLYNVSNMVPFLATAAVPGALAYKGLQAITAIPKLARIGGAIVGGSFGGAIEGAQTYRSVLEEGGTEEEAARAGELMTAGAGVLNALGIGGILAKAGTTFKAKVVKVLGAAAWEGLTEAAEEPTEVFAKYFGAYLADQPLPTGIKEQLIESAKAALTVAPVAAITGGGAAVFSTRGILEAEDVDTAISEFEKTVEIPLLERAPVPAIYEEPGRTLLDMLETSGFSMPDIGGPAVDEILSQYQRVKDEALYFARAEAQKRSSIPPARYVQEIGFPIPEAPITEIDKEANEAATSPLNDLPEPTQAQKEAGVYKKGHITLAGMQIAIENPRGSTRSGVGPIEMGYPEGKPWSVTLQNHYGYFNRTEGKDGDQIDVIIGQEIGSRKAFIVDQVDPKTGKFDEHKTLIGFKDIESARAGYMANYEEGWQGLGEITEVPIEEFKEWIGDGKRKSSPFATLSDVGEPEQEEIPPTKEELQAKIDQGEFIPKEVLSDYPDLVPPDEILDAPTDRVTPAEAPEPTIEAEAVPEAMPDRDTIVIDRVDGPVIFKRGDTVKVWINKDSSYEGEITGISHSREEAKVGNQWVGFGRLYEAAEPEPGKPKKTAPLSEIIDDINKKFAPPEEAIPDAVPEPTKKEQAFQEYADYVASLTDEQRAAAGDLILDIPGYPASQKLKIQKALSGEPVVEETPVAPVKAVSKLRTVGEATLSRAQEKYDQERNENTNRRAGMAASARADAAADIAIAETMLTIADGLEAGELIALGKVSSKAQVQTLDSILRDAQRKGHKDYAESLRRKGEPVVIEDVENAEYPNIYVGEGLQAGMRRDIEAIRGGKKLMRGLGGGAYLQFDDAQRILAFARKHGIAKDLPWSLDESVKKVSRLRTLGFTNLSELKEGLRELVNVRAGTKEEDPIKAMERELIGTKIPGFFPTREPVVNRMIEEADIEEGMDVLEPSAGMGNIAEGIRSAGVEPDVVEISGSLRPLLEEKGFNLVGSDFLEQGGEYDRIVMNPPFEKGQDVDHVRHAYSLLKPGGRIVSIMGEHPFFANDKKSVEFREWLDEVGTSEKLPEASFKGKEALRETGVNARLVVIDKPEGAVEDVTPAVSDIAKRAREQYKGWKGVEADEIEVTETPEGADVTADIPESEAEDLTPKEQKAFLMAEIDKAIEDYSTRKEAGEFTKATYLDGRQTEPTEEPEYTFEVPGDGTFVIRGDSLDQFKKNAKKFPSKLAKMPKPRTAEAINYSAETKKYPGYLPKPAAEMEPGDIVDLYSDIDTGVPKIADLGHFTNWLVAQDLSDESINMARDRYEEMGGVAGTLSQLSDATVRLKDALGDERGSFSWKEAKASATFADLSIVANDVYRQGAETLKAFRSRMQEVLSDIWDRIKNIVMNLYVSAKKVVDNERGQITIAEPARAVPRKKVPTGESPVIQRIFASETTIKDRISDFVAAGKSKEKRELALDQATANTLDKLHFIKVRLGDKPYKLHRVLTGIQSSSMATLFEHGKLEWDERGEVLTSKTRNKGIFPFFKSIGPDWKNLLYYVTAKRSEQLAKEGRENLITDQDRQDLYDLVGKTSKAGVPWEVLNKELQAFNKSVLDVSEQAGTIDPEARAIWEQEYYLPFYRDLENEITRQEYKSGPAKSMQHISAGIRRLKGGTAKLGDPVENLLKNWMFLLDSAARNKARAMASAVGQDIGIIKEVPIKDLINVLGSKTVKSWAALKPGNTRASHIFDDEGAAKEWVKEQPVPYRIEARKETIVKFGNMKDLGILSYQRKGKPVYITTEDQDLFNALLEVKTDQFNNMFMRLMGKAKRTLTYTATFGAGFKIRNALRDTIHVAIVSKNFKPFVDTAKGFMKSMREDQDWVEFAASGFAFGSSYIDSADPKAGARFVDRVIKTEGRGAGNRILDTFRKILNVWEKIGGASENAARVALFQNLREKGFSNLDSGFEARDLMDFSMSGGGTTTQLLIRTIPFLGARVQAFYKLGRAAKEDPKSFAIKSGMLTMASLALWSIFKDDDRYKELEDWDKWTYYHFWVEDTHYRIPKPFEIGAMFSSLPETLANVMNGTEEGKEMWDWFKFTANDMLRIDMPQLFKPIVEERFNKNLFTGRPIVPEYLTKLKASEQYLPWTSETARMVGSFLNISPMKFQHLVRGYFATIGMAVLSGLDVISQEIMGYPEGPARTIDDYGLGFVKRGAPVRSTKYVADFYELLKEMDSLNRTINHYRKTQQHAKIEDILKEERDQKLLFAKKRYDKVNKQIRVLNNRIKQVYWSAIEPSRKRQLIDELTERKNKLIQGLSI